MNHYNYRFQNKDIYNPIQKWTYTIRASQSATTCKHIMIRKPENIQHIEQLLLSSPMNKVLKRKEFSIHSRERLLSRREWYFVTVLWMDLELRSQSRITCWRSETDTV